MSEGAEPGVRKIIHVDMDAFFASVEQRDNPDLRGRPVAVGGSAKRGVVAAASYEAREYGVRSAMPSVTAARRCPGLVFVPPRFDVYKTVSRQVRDVFSRYTELIEPLSLDEAYLDVTTDRQGVGSAIRVARRIREEIRGETGLTASAGVSYNKFLAKIASDQDKPDGLFVILPGEGADFVASLPVRRFHGVGPRTAERMAQLGIFTGADLRAREMDEMVEHFGKFARYLYLASRGIDERPVRPDRVRKSVGRERTYGEDLLEEGELASALEDVIDSVWQRITDNDVVGRTVTLKIKFADFRQITRSRTEEDWVADRAQFASIARELLLQQLPLPMGVRLLGVTLSGLAGEDSATTVAEPPGGIGEQQSFEF